jgi:type I restriction enzyme S subunit
VYADDGIACLRMYNIDAGKIAWRDVKRMRLSEAELADYRLLPGDILVNRVNSRELVGKAAVIPDGLEPVVFESKNIRLRLDRQRVDPKFINYQFLLNGSQHFSRNAQQVVGMASISQKQLADFPVALPPLQDQEWTVAEIEKQFSRLDEAVANLKRVKANLKRYRAAVLKAAAEGRIVPTEAELARREGRSYETGEQLLARILAERRAAWEEQKAGGRAKRYIEPQPPETSYLPKLPEGWAWATVEQLTPPGRLCAYGVLQPGDEVSGGIPLVRVGDISEGRVDLPALKRISPLIAAKYPRTQLMGGEVLITLVGAIGRTAVATKHLRGANVARAVGIIPLTDAVSPNWVELWFRNPMKAAEMASKAHEVARKTLNLEDVRNAPVALPPMNEQRRLSEEAERRLSMAEETEAQVSANLRRADSLRQSILGKAFSICQIKRQ